jgi:hypothetical protein
MKATYFKAFVRLRICDATNVDQGILISELVDGGVFLE